MKRSLMFALSLLCFSVNLFTAESSTVGKKYNVGLCVMATGRYLAFAETMMESARKHFMNDQNVTFFLFTDGKPTEASDVVVFHQERLGWPKDTLLRCEVYLKQKEAFAEMDFIFACDADMLFVDSVGSEILGERVATQHPGFVGKRGSYETNKKSTACVDNNEGKYYFCGGFYGGSRDEFVNFLQGTLAQINKDFQRGLIAVWHDESHLNRYFIDHEPTVILDPSYCYPESWNLPYHKRLLALDKDHAAMRK